MKILHIVPSYLPAYRYGGPIQIVHGLSAALARQGVDMEVFTTAIDGPQDLKVPMNTPVMIDGVKVWYFAPGRLRSWFYAPGMRAALASRIKEFDMVHITSVFLAASTLGGYYARRAGVPYVISPQGSLMSAPLAKHAFKKNCYLSLFERRNLARAAAIHFTADIELQEYTARRLPLRRSILIPNGVDTRALVPGDPAGFRSKFGISPEKKIVLFLSRISWKKGLDTLVDAFASLANEAPEAMLVLAGGNDENYRPEIERQIAARGIGDRVIFTGALEGGLRSGAYQAAAVYALTSYSENFGVAVAEAMHFGVPVVITPEVGIASWVTAAEAGIVVSKDASQTRSALLKILGDPALAGVMGERGKAMVQKEFSYDSLAKQFLVAYHELIAGNNAGTKKI